MFICILVHMNYLFNSVINNNNNNKQMRKSPFFLV
jgi:hypothetical protein